MYYLSIDCANKSLAVGLYYIVEERIAGAKGDEIIGGLTDNIRVLSLDVFDLIPNKKVTDTDIIERSLALKNCMTKLNSKIDTLISPDEFPINVIIEYQMNVNDKSRTVSNQLVYEYADIDKYNLHIIPPVLKNTIFLSNDLRYCDFIAKYSTNYRCNKVHSKMNFLYFIKQFELDHMLKGIKKSNLDDIADTFMQVIAHLTIQ